MRPRHRPAPTFHSLHPSAAPTPPPPRPPQRLPRYITQRYAYWSSTLNRHIAAALGEANGSATEALGNVRTVRLLSTERFETDKYESLTRRALACGVRDACGGALAYALNNYLDLFTSVLILWRETPRRRSRSHSRVLGGDAPQRACTSQPRQSVSPCPRVRPQVRRKPRPGPPGERARRRPHRRPPGARSNSHLVFRFRPSLISPPAPPLLRRRRFPPPPRRRLTRPAWCWRRIRALLPQVTFQLYWGMFNGSYKSLQNVVTSFTRAAGSALRVLSLVDSAPDIGTGGPPPPPETELRGRLEFEDVRID